MGVEIKLWRRRKRNKRLERKQKSGKWVVKSRHLAATAIAERSIWIHKTKLKNRSKNDDYWGGPVFSLFMQVVPFRVSDWTLGSNRKPKLRPATHCTEIKSSGEGNQNIQVIIKIGEKIIRWLYRTLSELESPVLSYFEGCVCSSLMPTEISWFKKLRKRWLVTVPLTTDSEQKRRSYSWCRKGRSLSF